MGVTDEPMSILDESIITLYSVYSKRIFTSSLTTAYRYLNVHIIFYNKIIQRFRVCLIAMANGAER